MEDFNRLKLYKNIKLNGLSQKHCIMLTMDQGVWDPESGVLEAIP